MSNQITKKAIVPASARIKTYFDTQKVEQNGAVLNFFPPNSTRKITRNNYVGNPFPGELKRRILALSFEVTKQFIEDDEANGIDARGIVNSLKDAGVILPGRQRQQGVFARADLQALQLLRNRHAHGGRHGQQRRCSGGLQAYRLA
ncbi:MAG: hypothetical protein U5J89_09265, partial [Fodinibius sp.]|nr:hypothetical protein [Fodinibius sp.]